MKLSTFVAAMKLQFEGRITPLDSTIAATALTRSLTPVARNVKVSAALETSVVNPWED